MAYIILLLTNNILQKFTFIKHQNLRLIITRTHAQFLMQATIFND